MDLKKKILIGVKTQTLIKPGSKLLLGVSGGVDSVVLAHLFHQLRHDLAVSLNMVHFNHRLRATAIRDQRCVERLAKQLNIKLIIGRRSLNKIPIKTSEDQARQWRYQFFLKTAKRIKADAIVTAHHENDVAETVLMRLIRGTGMNGLRGILPHRLISGVSIIRPLLDIPRQEICAYAKEHKLVYCEDETNKKMHFLRNKVRHELLPLLINEYNPQMVGLLSDLAKTVSDDYDLLNELLLKQIKENLVKLKRTVKIKQAFLGSAHPALLRLMLRYSFELLNGDCNQLSYAHIMEAQELIRERPIGSIVHWPKGVSVLKKKGSIEIQA